MRERHEMPPVVWQMVDSSGVGGIETHIAVITESLRRHGIDARIVRYQDHGANAWLDQIAARGLSARHLDGTFRGLRQAMRCERPALVHLHGYKAGILGRLAAWSLGIPSVTTFHMGEAPKFPVSVYASLDIATAFLSTRIAVSGDIQRRLRFSSTIIPNYTAMALDEPTFGAAPAAIGFVGRLSHEKAPDHFCEIARRLADRDITWHIYGDGPMRGDLEARFGDIVNFHGMVSDMEAVWARLGLCLMPSRGEGLPLASIEALAHGVALVASDVGDLDKVVVAGTSGWLVPVGDLDGFVAATERWLDLDDAGKGTLRRTSWAHAVENFSERASLPQLLAVYQRLGVRATATVL